MATVNGNSIDIINEFTSTTTGRFVVWDAYNAPAGTETRRFKMRGFYVTGNVEEVWTALSPSEPPPSAHTLIDIHIVDMW